MGVPVVAISTDSLENKTLEEVLILFFQKKVFLAVEPVNSDTPLKVFFASIGDIEAESIILAALDKTLQLQDMCTCWKGKVDNESIWLLSPQNYLTPEEGSLPKSNIDCTNLVNVSTIVKTRHFPILITSPEYDVTYMNSSLYPFFLYDKLSSKITFDLPFVFGEKTLCFLQKNSRALREILGWTQVHIDEIRLHIKAKLNLESFLKSESDKSDICKLFYSSEKMENKTNLFYRAFKKNYVSRYYKPMSMKLNNSDISVLINNPQTSSFVEFNSLVKSSPEMIADVALLYKYDNKDFVYRQLKAPTAKSSEGFTSSSKISEIYHEKCLGEYFIFTKDIK